jgi:cyanophycinase
VERTVTLTRRLKSALTRLGLITLALGLPAAAHAQSSGAGAPAAASSTSAASAPAARPPGAAVPIGGGLKAEHDAVWQRLVQLAGGPGARFVVFGTASESPLESARAAAAQLQRRGAVAEVLAVSPLLKDRPIAEAVRDPALIAQVNGATGVFFTGGSQDRITDHLAPGGRPTPLLDAIWGVYRAGGVVAGTSAGAAIMSETMFRDAPSLLRVLKGQLRVGQEIGAGLGFVGPGLFVDQHFLKRGRIGRSLPLMHAAGLKLGIGVEEDSAVLVRGGELEVIGGKAVLMDLGHATHDASLGAFNLAGVRISLLDRGDRYRLASAELLPAPHKLAGQVLDPRLPGYKPYYTEAPYYTDFLGDNVLGTAMGLLIDAKYPAIEGLAFDPRPPAGEAQADLGFVFRLSKAADSHGWYSEAGGGEDYTVHRLLLDVRPVRLARPLMQPWTLR